MATPEMTPTGFSPEAEERMMRIHDIVVENHLLQVEMVGLIKLLTPREKMEIGKRLMEAADKLRNRR